MANIRVRLCDVSVCIIMADVHEAGAAECPVHDTDQVIDQRS
jgi:hypothetical protein